MLTGLGDVKVISHASADRLPSKCRVDHWYVSEVEFRAARLTLTVQGCPE
jgi:hypothetical protein